jgi:transposase
MAWRRGQAYAQDLRDRVLAAEGPAAAVADRFGVSISYVVKARQRRDRHGQVCAGVQRSQTPAKLAAHDAALRQHVACEPDATLAELVAWAATEFGVSVSITAMWARLRRLKLTLKKRPSSPPSRRAQMSPKHAGYGMS